MSVILKGTELVKMKYNLFQLPSNKIFYIFDPKCPIMLKDLLHSWLLNKTFFKLIIIFAPFYKMQIYKI